MIDINYLSIKFGFMASSYRVSTSAFQEALDEYANLDLTTDILSEESEQLGGGGFSDVFRSQMQTGWKTREDYFMEQLLSDIWVKRMALAARESKSDCLMVAVKRLRFWGMPIPKVEKACCTFLPITCIRLN